MFGKAYVLLILAMVFTSLVSASAEKRMVRETRDASRLQNRAGQDCLKCAQSYVDCFNLFGLQGCTDPNAEHFTYCRNCYGVNPPW